ncbi:MAG: hypothetical protein RIB44_17335 [Lacipirellulaceae bacterium]
MKKLIAFLPTAMISLFCSGQGFATPQEAKIVREDVVFRDGEKTWTYQKSLVRGWTIYIEQALIKDEKLLVDLNAELVKSFAHIEKVVPDKPLKFLKAVPVWVSHEKTYPFRKGENGVIPFHRSKQWLRSHGLNPHMAPGVHVINPKAVLYEHRVFEWGPMTILHELSHAYHNLHLKLDHPTVKNAYQNAMAAKLYLKVPDRSDPKKKVRAYAATNQEEYFAELTEAYFGTNDWYPRNREELKVYDPQGFEMIEVVWKVRDKR